MDGINEVKGKAPESTEKVAPFEIVIRTRDPQYIAQGGPVEMVIPCKGYTLTAMQDGEHRFCAQGDVDELAVVAALARNFNHKHVFLAAGLGLLGSKDEQ